VFAERKSLNLAAMWRVLVGIGMVLLFFGCESTSEESDKKGKRGKTLPIVHIHHNYDLNFEEKKECRISYMNAKGDTLFYFLPSKAKYRGGHSSKYNKKSYTINLSQRHKLAKMKKNTDWMLISSYSDKSFVRHKVSYDLFRSFSKNNIAPKSKYVELYCNDNYKGLYLLTEQMNAKRLKLDKKDTTSSNFKDPYVFRIKYGLAVFHGLADNDLFHQKYPNVTKANRNYQLDEMRALIFDASDASFLDTTTGIAAHFDLDNIIDWHLLLLFTNNGDGLCKNFYCYRQNDTEKFKIAPWDYDATFGRDGDYSPNPDRYVDFNTNGLLKRLMELNAFDYNTRLKTRYVELKKKGKLTVDKVHEMIDKNYKKIKPYLQKNFELWPADDDNYSDKNTTEEEILYMKKWVKNHVKHVETYINSL
jgi:spore coat protein H